MFPPATPSSTPGLSRRGRGEASRFVMTKLNHFTVVTSKSGTQDCWGFFSFVCFVFSIALPVCLM